MEVEMDECTPLIRDSHQSLFCHIVITDAATDLTAQQERLLNEAFVRNEAVGDVP